MTPSCTERRRRGRESRSIKEQEGREDAAEEV
jgi:hypothetical protein